MAEYPVKEKYNAEDLAAIIAILRDPVSGCPWDKVQTHQSIRKNFLEETYEALEAIDADDAGMLCEELGDVLMQIMLHSEMEAEKGTFSFLDVCDGVCKKLIYRHPHIFDKNASDCGLSDWDALKNKEKQRNGLADELATVPVTFPALMKAQKTQKRANGYGLAAKDAASAQAALAKAKADFDATCAKPDTHAIEMREQAAGKYLFAAADLLRCEGIDAEQALEKETKWFHAAHGGDK